MLCTMAKQTCFVVMGFGKKTDFQTGRVLDLDKTYKYIIKPAVAAAGLECVRADEIKHSGIIDVPMYEQLLKADVVVADLSTSNCNACYELGVRHALKPFTTIIIAESQFKYPFDFSHIAIRSYTHLGETIDVEEAENFRAKLQDAIESIASQPANDSPVYEFLKIKPPHLDTALDDAPKIAAPMPAAASVSNETVSALMKQVDVAFAGEQFTVAKSLLQAVQTMLPTDSYVTQKLALATYKSKAPSPIAALQEARVVLSTLDPKGSNDSETLGLWGAIHKRLWELTEDTTQLTEAIFGYEKGFYLKSDYYNGINLAYLLNVRAALACAKVADSVADFVLAQRTRATVISMCQTLLDAEKERGKPLPDHYWIAATLGEALFGLGRQAEANTVLEKAYLQADHGWCADTTREQIKKLDTYLQGFPYRQIVGLTQ
jgi:tetratricopeptide (TPR) repeat protein